MIEPFDFLEQLFQAAIERSSPQALMKTHLPPLPKGRTWVLGAGKASVSMAMAFEEAWNEAYPSSALSGLVVTPYGHLPKGFDPQRSRIEVMQAAHPVPDMNSMLAAQSLLARAQGLGRDDLVVVLISGGGSSLLCCPIEGMTLNDKQSVNRALLQSGASIDEMNAVRKHLSQIKGGRLLQALQPAQVLTLCISDVPGDDPQTIASGPSVADLSTSHEAFEVLQRYRIEVPPSIRDALRRGELETPKPGDFSASLSPVRIIASARDALNAAAELAKREGIDAYILADDVQGESKDVALMHASLARFAANGLGAFKKPCVLLSGGETTVTLDKLGSSPAQEERGRGGRAGEFCLSLARALNGAPGIWALVADTDGIDGSSSAAGARVGPHTLSQASALGLNLNEYAQRHDAHGFFSALSDLVVTGPTLTNVNDFRAILIV